jgi:hypothetical protein
VAILHDLDELTPNETIYIYWQASVEVDNFIQQL